MGIVPRLMNWFDPKPGIVEQLQTGATTGVNVILTIAVVAIVAKGFNSGFFANIWNFNSDSHKLDELNKNYENLLLYLSDLHNKVDGLGWAVNRLNINENVLSNAHDIFRNEVLDEFNSIKKAFNEYTAENSSFDLQQVRLFNEELARFRDALTRDQVTSAEELQQIVESLNRVSNNLNATGVVAGSELRQNIERIHALFGNSANRVNGALSELSSVVPRVVDTTLTENLPEQVNLVSTISVGPREILREREPIFSLTGLPTVEEIRRVSQNSQNPTSLFRQNALAIRGRSTSLPNLRDNLNDSALRVAGSISNLEQRGTFAIKFKLPEGTILSVEKVDEGSGIFGPIVGGIITNPQFFISVAGAISSYASRMMKPHTEPSVAQVVGKAGLSLLGFK